MMRVVLSITKILPINRMLFNTKVYSLKISNGSTRYFSTTIKACPKANSNNRSIEIGLPYLACDLQSTIIAKYRSQLVGTEHSSIQGRLKNAYGGSTFPVGPVSFYENYFLKVSLVSISPSGRLVFSPHKFYDPSDPNDKKFVNPIYIPSKSLEITGDCYKIQNLKFARSLLNDLLHDKNEPKCIIRYYWNEEEFTTEDVKGQICRSVNEIFQFWNIWLAVARAKPGPNGTFIVDPNDPAVLSNRFRFVRSKNDIIIPGEFDHVRGLIYPTTDLIKPQEKICNSK